MQKIHYTTTINASKEKVWKTLWEDATYREWTSVFDPQSRVEGELAEGNTVKFLGSGDAGMYAEVAKLVPNEFMSFKHLGEVQDGKEKPFDEVVFENYTLREEHGVTEVEMELDAPDEYKDMFAEMFPKALEKLKMLAEK